MKKLAILGMLAVACLAFTASPSTAAIITIDDYSTTTGQGVNTTNVTTSAGPTTFAGTNILAGFGGNRTLSLQSAFPGPGTTATFQNGIGALVLDNGTNVISTGLAQYSGLADLTGLVAFQLLNTTNDGGNTNPGSVVDGTIEVRDTANNIDTFIFQIPVGSTALINIPIPGGSPVDFSAINRIRLSLDTTTGSQDVSLDNFQAITAEVPEPTTIVCFSLSCVCAAAVGAYRRRTKKVS